MQGFNYTQLYQAMQDWPYKRSEVYLANINRMIFLGELRFVRDLDLEIFDIHDTLALSLGQTQLPKPPQSQPITFTGGLAQGAMSGTLNANWTGVTGVYVVTFSDNELQAVTLTNGVNSANWPQGLLDAVGPAARVNSQYVAERTLRILYNGAPKRLVKRSYDFVTDYSTAAAGQPLYYCDLTALLWLCAPATDANATLLMRHYIDRPQSIVVAGNTYLGDNFGDALFAACLLEAEGFLKADDRYADIAKKYYQELLPNARGEAMVMTRLGVYNPLMAVASLPAPPAPPVQQAQAQGQ